MQRHPLTEQNIAIFKPVGLLSNSSKLHFSGIGPSSKLLQLGMTNPPTHPHLGKVFFKKWAKPSLFFCLLSFFSHDKYSTNTINEKSIEGVLGTRTRGGRMVCADESTELWRQPMFTKHC